MTGPGLSPAPWPRPFTSALHKREAIAVLLYLPLHTLLLRQLFGALIAKGALSAGSANFVYYAVGFAYMLAAAFGFLRREFDALADRPLRAVGEVLSCYALMLAANFLVSSLLLLLLPDMQNPGNQTVMQAASAEPRSIRATVVFLVPLTEEMLFRAGVFGLLRRKNRTAAYLVSMLSFSLCHVLPYAALDPLFLLYFVQYLPASYLLARCYERSSCIWCSIFFHMLTNAVSLHALQALEGLM